MSFAAMIGRRRQLVVPTPPDEPEEPPPDPEGAVWRQNEPVGATPLWDRTFADLTLGSGLARTVLGTWHGSGIVSTPEGLFLATSFAQVYPEGLTSGGVEKLEQYPDDSYYNTILPTTINELYTCVLFRFSDNFRWHSSGHKFWYSQQYDEEKTVVAGRGYEVSIKRTGERTDPGFKFSVEVYADGNALLAENLPDLPALERGKEYMVETIERLSPWDVREGEFHLWAAERIGDGFGPSVKRMQHTGLKLTPNGYPGCHARATLDGYYGGSGGDALPAAQQCVYNRVYASGRTV